VQLVFREAFDTIIVSFDLTTGGVKPPHSKCAHMAQSAYMECGDSLPLRAGR
jgi:hypothetical protein